MTFLLRLGATETLCSFRLVLEGRAGKEVPQSTRLKFFEKFLAKTFTLSDAEDTNSRALNTACIADLLLLSTPLAICQKYQEPSLLKVIDSLAA